MLSFRRCSAALVCAAALSAGAACNGERRAVPPEPTPVPGPAPAPPNPQPQIVTVRGLVRESGAGPLGGATVEWFTTRAPGAVPGGFTADDGTFSARPAAGDILSFWSASHFRMLSPVPVDANPDEPLDIVVTLQRILVVSADAPVTALLTDDDATHTEMTSDAFFDGEYACGPCKRIDVLMPPASGLLRVTWTGEVPLTLWAADTYGPPTRFTRTGEREIAVPILTRLYTLLIGRDAGSGPLGAPVRFTVAIER